MRRRKAPATVSQDQQRLHVLNRITFGPSIASFQAISTVGVTNYINAQLAPKNLADPIADLPLDRYDYSLQEIQSWWLLKIFRTERQLLERMTLFWHNFFATGNRRVLNPYLMYLQNRTFRQYALGSFRDLLKAMATDGAMLIWLQGDQGDAGLQSNGSYGIPPENFGREVLQRFSLGAKGNPALEDSAEYFTEDDVREGARAWSGWHVSPTPPYAVTFNPAHHDDRAKYTLGGSIPARSGSLGKQDIDSMIDLIFAVQPTDVQVSQVSRWVCQRLIQYFVTDFPSQEYIDYVAQGFGPEGNITACLQRMFTSSLFQNSETYHRLVKSPTELVLSVLRVLQPNFTVQDTTRYLASLSFQGQELLNPSTVFGWPRGSQWFSFPNQLERLDMITRLCEENSYDPLILSNAVPDDPLVTSRDEEVFDYFFNLLLVRDTVPEVKDDLRSYFFAQSGASTKAEKMRGLLNLMMACPEFNLR